MPTRRGDLDLSADSIVFLDDGQPLVEVARALDDGQPLVEVARVAWIETVADIDGIVGEGMEEMERTDGGGRTVGAGQVTEILERVDGGDSFVFGETMYFE